MLSDIRASLKGTDTMHGIHDTAPTAYHAASGLHQVPKQTGTVASCWRRLSFLFLPCGCSELSGMRASLMGIDAILPRHCIMAGQIHASPVFDNASRALQRLSLDNEATTAIAGGNPPTMEGVLEMAVRLNNPVVARRLQVQPHKMTDAKGKGACSTRSVWQQHSMSHTNCLCLFVSMHICSASWLVPFSGNLQEL